MYGPSAMFVHATGDGVNGFTPDPGHRRVHADAPGHPVPVRRALLQRERGGRARGYSHRYTGALVADVHRALVEGGSRAEIERSEDFVRTSGGRTSCRSD
jgi:fructose-1,6-bisphosphatase